MFGKDGLGIFSGGSEYTEGEPNKTWQRLYKRDLRLATTHPPSNYFQQMILWTEQGKLWKFPIDNEQGSNITVNYVIAFFKYINFRYGRGAKC